MPAPFEQRPTPAFLTQLSRNPLAQGLGRATRLWVMLHSIYGESAPWSLDLPNEFTYNDWRLNFFNDAQKHHTSDTAPGPHDPTCPCAHSLTDWLFHPELGCDRPRWTQDYLSQTPISDDDLDQLLHPKPSRSSKAPSDATGEDNRDRLFALTGRALKGYFDDLVTLNYLELTGTKPRTYRKVDNLPDLSASQATSTSFDLREAVGNVIETDLADFFEHLGRPLRGIQRLSINLDYIVPGQRSMAMGEWQEQLRELWEQNPVPPVRLRYRSARLGGNEGEFITYPVCIHYVQRAPYLYAYGNTPLQPKTPEWYEFRLDRIFAITPLTWDDPAVDSAMLTGFRDRCTGPNPPSPSDVTDLLDYVWGYDISMPAETLLVRFDRDFYRSYVAGTERESRLLEVSLPKRTDLIKRAEISASQRQHLLQRLVQCPNDIYRQAQIRQGDRNIIMRLRAWGPMVEVLLPAHLRDRMAEDFKAACQLYTAP